MLAVVVVAQAERYPAGLNPDLCPNYPYCSSVHYSPYVPYAVASSHNYPAGVNPISCPNYPYCSQYVPHVAVASVLRYSAARQYPTGVSAAACPNYQFVTDARWCCLRIMQTPDTTSYGFRLTC